MGSVVGEGHLGTSRAQRKLAQAQGGRSGANPECGVWFLVEIPASESQICLGQAPYFPETQFP